MNNKEFDKLIKSSLKNMSSKAQPNWGRMERHVEEWEIKEGLVSDDYFDSVIAEKLEGVKVDYDQSSWPKLEEKMLQRRSLRRKIIFYQMTGVAVILLLFALVFQLNPSKFNTYQNDLVVEQSSEMTDLKQAVTDPNSTENRSYESTDRMVLPVDEERDDANQELVNMNLSKGIDGENAASGSLPLVVASEVIPLRHLEGSLVDSQLSAQSSLDELRSNSSLKGNSLSNETGILSEGVLDERQNADVWLVKKTSFFVEKLPKSVLLCSSYQNLQLAEFEQEVLLPFSDQLAGEKGQKSSLWNLALYGQPQYLFLKSPYDALMSEPGYFRTWTTAGLGMGIDFRMGSWSFGAGMEYSRLSYSPRKIEERLDGSDALIHLASISGDMLTVPLQAKYYWKDSGRFSFYTSLGLSFRVAMATDYEILRSEQGLTDLIQDLRTNPVYQNTLYSQKEYEPGLLEGGDASNQIMAGVELASGIQFHLDERYSLFAEPAFRYDLSSGFGPNQDKIHQLSLRAGLRGLLN